MSFPRAEHNLEDKHGLFLVCEPRSPLRAVCDIVAVHGLGGGAASTWRHKQTHFLWLRDCLPTIPEDIPRGTTVRIWTFGYNANTVFSTAVAGISEFTQSLLSFIDEARIGQDGRKVIFIAHSLGGVVVKSALIDAARRGSQHSWLLDTTIGIVFLATPHQGSKIANKGSFVANIAKYTGIVRPNGETLRSLKRNSGELFDKAEQFRTICGEIQICSFYETLTMGSFGLIVEKSSAMMGLPQEEPTPLTADHRTICKFESSGDQNLKLVQNSIKRMIYFRCMPNRVTPTMNNPFRQPRDDNEGPHWGRRYQPPNFATNPQWSNNQEVPSAREYQQDQSSSPYQDNDFVSSFASFDSRPSTNASTQSFNTQYSDPRSNGRGSFISSQVSFTQDQEQNSLESRNQGAPPPRQSPNTGVTRSRFLRPQSSTYSLSQTQLADINRNTSSTSPRKPIPSLSNSPPPPSLPAEDVAYECDACLNDFGSKTPRFHCTVCDDYDLCPVCYQKDRTSKGHSTKHKVMSISKTHQLEFNDITPANVIPEKSPPRTLPNWTVDNEDRRWLHLRNSSTHERYIVHGMSPGAYLVQIVITFKFSDFVSTAILNQLKKESLGEMKIIAGAPINARVFFSEQKNDVTDDNLAEELLSSGRQFTSQLKLPDEVTNPNQTWHKTFDYSATPIHIGANSDVKNTCATLAVLLQWSNVRKFATNDNPLLLCTVECMRMDELLEYDEPSPPVSRVTTPQPSSSSINNLVADADDDEHVTLEELLDATKILIENNKAVTPDNLLTIVMATREVQTELQKALLLRHIQQVQQQQRLERQQRLAAQTQAAQAQAAADLFLLGLFLS